MFLITPPCLYAPSLLGRPRLICYESGRRVYYIDYDEITGSSSLTSCHHIFAPALIFFKVSTQSVRKLSEAALLLPHTKHIKWTQVSEPLESRIAHLARIEGDLQPDPLPS